MKVWTRGQASSARKREWTSCDWFLILHLLGWEGGTGFQNWRCFSRSLVHQLEALRHLKMQGKEKGKRANLKNDCLPGFGRARKGTSLFHEIVRRKDGCSLRKVSLSKSSLTNILPFGFPEISTNRVRSILEIWRNFLFVLLYRKDSLEETGMSLHR